MQTPASIHPHDRGLPPATIRKRRHAHRLARWMLLIAILTAAAGWPIYGRELFLAATNKDTPFFRVFLGYSLLIISSITLILGLWYLLIAQVARIARIVESDDLPTATNLKCPNCGWPHDAPDRFCRHCGKPLITPPNA